MSIAKNKNIILFVLAVIGVVYIGTINDIKYQESLNENNYVYEYDYNLDSALS